MHFNLQKFILVALVITISCLQCSLQSKVTTNYNKNRGIKGKSVETTKNNLKEKRKKKANIYILGSSVNVITFFKQSYVYGFVVNNSNNTVDIQVKITFKKGSEKKFKTMYALVQSIIPGNKAIFEIATSENLSDYSIIFAEVADIQNSTDTGESNINLELVDTLSSKNLGDKSIPVVKALNMNNEIKTFQVMGVFIAKGGKIIGVSDGIVYHLESDHSVEIKLIPHLYIGNYEKIYLYVEKILPEEVD